MAVGYGGTGGPGRIGTVRPLLSSSPEAEFDSRQRYGTGGAVLHDFEDLSDWEVLDGTLTADSDSPYAGTQSGRLAAGTDQKRAMIAYTGTPLDLTDHDLSMALRLGNPESQQATLVICAPDWDNRVEMTQSIQPSLDSWFRADFGVTDEAGSPDLANVQRLVLYVYTGGGERVRLWVDDLRVIPKADRGYVMFTFDDTWDSQYENAFSAMAEYDYPGVAAINSSRVGEMDRLTLEQLKELQANDWDIVNHASSHARLPKTSTDEIEAEIRDCKQWLVDNGFDAGAETFVYPFGAADGRTLELVGKYHVMGFGTGGSNQGTRITDPLTIERSSGADVPAAKRAIDLAAKHRQLCVLAYHSIGDDNGFQPVSDGAFRETLEHIERHGDDLSVTTPAVFRSEVMSDASTSVPYTTAAQNETSPAATDETSPVPTDQASPATTGQPWFGQQFTASNRMWETVIGGVGVLAGASYLFRRPGNSDE